jgi:hypothetical protein
VLYSVDPATGTLTDPVGTIRADYEPYGLCMYRSQASGRFYVFVTGRNLVGDLDGYVEQWELSDNGSGQIAAEKVRAVSGTGPYAPQGNAVADSLASESTRRRSSPPELIAKTIGKAVTARRPKTRYAAGYGAKPMIFLHDVLPDRAFDAFIRRAVRMPS